MTIGLKSNTYIPIADDYTIYHQQVNYAEHLFLSGSVDSSIALYKKTFKEFGFVFAKDCIVAAQIAAYSNESESALYFIHRALLQGVKIICLKDIPILDIYLAKADKWKHIGEVYDSLHTQYLRSIDFKKKMKYVSYYLEEQNAKNNGSIDYTAIVYANYSSIKKETLALGFPGDKVLGIDDESYEPESEDGRLSCENTLITLYHYPCSFTEMKELLLPEIKKGNIHPRDYAYISEFEHRLFVNNHNRFPQCNPSGNYSNYKIDWFKSYTEDEIKTIYDMRSKIYICSFQQDLQKKEMEEKHNFKFFFGFGIGFFEGHR